MNFREQNFSLCCQPTNQDLATILGWICAQFSILFNCIRWVNLLSDFNCSAGWKLRILIKICAWFWLNFAPNFQCCTLPFSICEWHPLVAEAKWPLVESCCCSQEFPFTKSNLWSSQNNPLRTRYWIQTLIQRCFVQTRQKVGKWYYAYFCTFEKFDKKYLILTICKDMYPFPACLELSCVIFFSCWVLNCEN